MVVVVVVVVGSFSAKDKQYVDSLSNIYQLSTIFHSPFTIVDIMKPKFK